MSWYDTLKERAFKFLFKEEAKKIESLEQKYEELKSDKELSGIYNNLTSDYDIYYLNSFQNEYCIYHL